MMVEIQAAQTVLRTGIVLLLAFDLLGLFTNHVKKISDHKLGPVFIGMFLFSAITELAIGNWFYAVVDTSLALVWWFLLKHRYGGGGSMFKLPSLKPRWYK